MAIINILLLQREIDFRLNILMSKVVPSTGIVQPRQTSELYSVDHLRGYNIREFPVKDKFANSRIPRKLIL